MKLTEEQKSIVDAVCSSKNQIITVNAVAGSGKTSTAVALAQAFKPKDGFYTAFNRGIVADSKAKFNGILACRTMHSLAWQAVQPNKIQDLNYNSFSDKFSNREKYFIINHIDNFFRSSILDIEDYLERFLRFNAKKCHVSDDCYHKCKVKNNYILYENTKDTIIDFTHKMLSGEIDPTYNCMLKMLHIMLAHGNVRIKHDLLILDEAQDTTAVTLEIIKLIESNKKVILGDRFQNIYDFLKTVNAFDLLKDTSKFNLTQSFRCNEQIANVVQNFGRKCLDANFVFKGNPNTPKSNTFAYISRTNSSLIFHMKELINENKKFKLIRGINEIFEVPEAIINAYEGNKVPKKYEYFVNEVKECYKTATYCPEFLDYLDHLQKNFPEDITIQSATKLLGKLECEDIDLKDLKDRINSNVDKNSNYILSTAHSYKGLEAGTVIISEDFHSIANDLVSKIEKDCQNKNLLYVRKHLKRDEISDLNTYYVALSRAVNKLILN